MFVCLPFSRLPFASSIKTLCRRKFKYLGWGGVGKAFHSQNSIEQLWTGIDPDSGFENWGFE